MRNIYVDEVFAPMDDNRDGYVSIQEYIGMGLIMIEC